MAFNVAKIASARASLTISLTKSLRVAGPLLRNITKTVVYLDDIMVTGRTHEEHDRTPAIVLTQLLDAGLRTKKNKCAFHRKSCIYLANAIHSDGIHTMQDKAQAVLNAPAPQNVQEVMRCLGLIH